ncbi:MAG: cobalamin B12-binding domain-containing protein [Candidatus Bathyarchaeia archaeon]
MGSQEILERFKNSIVELNIDQALEATREALKVGVSPYDIMEAMRSASSIVGEKFESCEYFISELVIAGSIMKAATDLLKPHLSKGEAKYRGKVVIGSAPGDLHDIGKNLVAVSLMGAGFEVVDLGIDVSPEKFVQAVKDEQPNIVGISALTSTTMMRIGEVIEALRMSALRSRVKVILGGAPLTEEFSRNVGADAYARDVVQGVKICEGWISGAVPKHV